MHEKGSKSTSGPRMCGSSGASGAAEVPKARFKGAEASTFQTRSVMWTVMMISYMVETSDAFERSNVQISRVVTPQQLIGTWHIWV